MRAKAQAVASNNPFIILYFNARSVLPKHDELKILAEVDNLDVICITVRLCQEMCDTELSIPGYLLYRRDRNRHGGGVLMYIKKHIQVRTLPQCPDLELFVLSLYKLKVVTGFVWQLFLPPPPPPPKFLSRGI